MLHARYSLLIRIDTTESLCVIDQIPYPPNTRHIPRYYAFRGLGMARVASEELRWSIRRAGVVGVVNESTL